MKLFMLLVGIMFLASCTANQVPTPISPSPVKNTTPSELEGTGMMKDEKMEEPMMKDESMMTGSDSGWTKEQMDAIEKQKMMTGSETMMKEEPGESMMSSETTTMQKSIGYMNYDEAKVKDALSNGQKVVLFFHASWCPTCRALDNSINSDISSIPADTLIVKVDYDTSDAMKQKYGVTSQHTTVLIDKDMNLVSKKLGAKNISEILN